MSVNTERALDLSLVLIRRFEGLRLRPYLCSAGVPTIGYGSTYYLDGSRVRLTDPPISKELAEELLKKTVLSTYFPATISLCPTLETEGQLAAITSFTYNLGVNALKTSTLRKKILAKEWKAAKKELLKWNKAGGQESRGLTIRRKAEAEIFLPSQSSEQNS